MRKITSALNGGINLLGLSRFSATTISYSLLYVLANWQHSGQFLAIFSLRMRRNSYYSDLPVKISTPAFDSVTHNFLIGNDISAIWRRFLLIFCIRYAECPPHFYFRSSWPTELESVSLCFAHHDEFFLPSLKSIRVSIDTLYSKFSCRLLAFRDIAGFVSQMPFLCLPLVFTHNLEMFS